jgi:hypothetical protein
MMFMRFRVAVFVGAALLASGLGFAAAGQRPAATPQKSAATSVVVFKSAT